MSLSTVAQYKKFTGYMLAVNRHPSPVIFLPTIAAAFNSLLSDST